MIDAVVGHEPFDGANGNGFVQLASPAGVLARMGADPSANARKDILLPDQVQRFRVFSRLGERDIALGVHAERAVGGAKGGASLVYHGPSGKAETTRVTQRLVSIGIGNRAGFVAFSAQDASLGIDKGLLPDQVHAEALLGVLDSVHPGGKDALDGGISQDPNHARTMGVIERHPGIQLPLVVGQFPVQVRVRIHQGDPDSQLAQLVGRRDTGRGCADDHDFLQSFLGAFHMDAPVLAEAFSRRAFSFDNP